MNIRELFAARLQECYDALAEGGDKAAALLKGVIKTSDELQTCLSDIKKEQEYINKNIENCDQKVKIWQQSKKEWKARMESLNEMLMETLSRLNVKTASDGTVKVTMTTKRGIEVVDPAILLKPYEAEIKALQAVLPPYVKVSVDIDKTKLASHLKNDESLLLTQPENIHYKDSRSIRLN